MSSRPYDVIGTNPYIRNTVIVISVAFLLLGAYMFMNMGYSRKKIHMVNEITSPITKYVVYIFVMVLTFIQANSLLKLYVAPTVNTISNADIKTIYIGISALFIQSIMGIIIAFRFPMIFASDVMVSYGITSKLVLVLSVVQLFIGIYLYNIISQRFDRTIDEDMLKYALDAWVFVLLLLPLTSYMAIKEGEPSLDLKTKLISDIAAEDQSQAKTAADSLKRTN